MSKREYGQNGLRLNRLAMRKARTIRFHAIRERRIWSASEQFHVLIAKPATVIPEYDSRVAATFSGHALADFRDALSRSCCVKSKRFRAAQRVSLIFHG